MRTARTMAVLLGALLLASIPAPPARAHVDVSFDFFYTNLEPYGAWHVSAEYGRVWQPNVYTAGWNPYYDGHWACTDVGWSWVSDYPWGSVPYHYGTWVLDPRWGWVWVPGTTWAPSWVVFRTGPDYIGWAPVPPSFSVGMSASFHDDPAWYVVVGAGDFLAPRVRPRVYPMERTRSVLRHATFVNTLRVENDVVVNRGPDLRFVERASGKRVTVVPIERVHRAAPARNFTKSDLRAFDRGGDGLRAAEPVSRNVPLPKHERSFVTAPRIEPRTHDTATIDAQRGSGPEPRGEPHRDPRIERKAKPPHDKKQRKSDDPKNH